MKWHTVDELICAYRSISDLEAKKLRDLTAKLSKLLAPFDDPFLTDFGVHRWLASAREEVYSDWLAWLFQQIRDPISLLTILFGTADPRIASQCMGPLKVNREFGLSDENGRRRRTDLELIFGDQKTALVEIKKGDASDIDKNQLEILAARRSGFTYYILLARCEGTVALPTPFLLLTWGNLCLRLRALVQARFLKSSVQTAMMLAFVGAVEQNLLGMPGNLAQRLDRNELLSTSIRRRMEEYLGIST